jgi:hypothetical protein
MSSSSLWGIKKDYTGEKLEEYGNSWLFSPLVWDTLCEKYIPSDIHTSSIYKKSITGIGGRDIWIKANDALNNSDDIADRVCWELSNQCVYATKDKLLIANSIRKFAEQNKEYSDKSDDGEWFLQVPHIVERFEEIASDIEALDENEYPYFVFKNTSVDDAVESWFYKYDAETDEYVECSLKELDKTVTEFVVIKDEKITDFVTNIDFKYM